MWVVAALLVAALAAAGVAAAAALGTVTLKRCGFTKATYGRSAVYPWHMSCAQARRIIAGSDDPHAVSVNLPDSDGSAVAIGGKFWVCAGQMGIYGCGYPWRPIAVHHAVSYTGPFTQRVFFEACSIAGPGSCGPTAAATQPPLSHSSPRHG